MTGFPNRFSVHSEPVRRRVERKTARRRRDHYIARIEAAPAGKRRLNEAVDYLRAAMARAPEEMVDAVVCRLVAMADVEGDLE